MLINSTIRFFARKVRPEMFVAIAIAPFLFIGDLHAQSFLNITPALPSINSEARIFIGQSDQYGIRLMGDLLDSIGVDSQIGAVPYTGLISSSGQMKYVSKKIQGLPFAKMNHNPYNAKFLDTNQVYSRISAYPGPFKRIDHFALVDFQTNSVIISVAFDEPLDSILDIRLAATDYLQNGGFAHVCAIANETGQGIKACLMDSSFSVVNEVSYVRKGTYMIPGSIRLTDDCNYDIIGWQMNTSMPESPEHFDLFYLRISQNGDVLVNKYLDADEAYFTAGTGVNQMYFEDNGDVVMFLSEIAFSSSLGGGGAYGKLPCIIKAAPEFDSVIWKTCFNEIVTSDDGEVEYLNGAGIICADSSGYVAVAVREVYTKTSEELHNSVCLYKVNTLGDIAWFSNYLPSEWDFEQMGFAFMYDLHEDSLGNLLAVGQVFDRDRGTILPYLLYTDSNGCDSLSCTITSTSVLPPNDLSRVECALVDIYPNPVTSVVHLEYLDETSEMGLVRIISINGKCVFEKELKLTKGFKNTLDLYHLSAGSYIIQVSLLHNNCVQLSKLVVIE